MAFPLALQVCREIVALGDELGPKRSLFFNLHTTAKDGRDYECNRMENVAAGQNGDLRMHQGLLQSALPSLVTVLKKPCRLRTENG